MPTVADMAITSAGRTVFELASVAVPMMVIAQNIRETKHVFACTSPGVKYCGKATELKEDFFIDTFQKLVGNKLVREKMKDVLFTSNLRDGITNVLEVIEKTLKGSKL